MWGYAYHDDETQHDGLWGAILLMLTTVVFTLFYPRKILSRWFWFPQTCHFVDAKDIIHCFHIFEPVDDFLRAWKRSFFSHQHRRNQPDGPEIQFNALANDYPTNSHQRRLEETSWRFAGGSRTDIYLVEKALLFLSTAWIFCLPGLKRYWLQCIATKKHFTLHFTLQLLKTNKSKRPISNIWHMIDKNGVFLTVDQIKMVLVFKVSVACPCTWVRGYPHSHY